MGDDNGLSAQAYAPLADLDPPFVAEVLRLLADEGIAAYVEPSIEQGPYREVQSAERVQVRLHVDRSLQAEARETLGTHLPALRAGFLADSAARDDRAAMAEAEVNAAWNEIVAGFDAGDPPTRSGLSSRLIRQEPTTWREHTSSLDDVGDDPDDHYQPPPPPPLPSVHPVTRLAWAGVIGGPLFVLLVAVVGLQLEPWLILLALLAFCGGVATLVARMADRPRQDDGWDDGAVV